MRAVLIEDPATYAKPLPMLNEINRQLGLPLRGLAAAANRALHDYLRVAPPDAPVVLVIDGTSSG